MHSIETHNRESREMSKLTKSQKEKVIKALAQHDKFRSSYFWTPPTLASDRRYLEKKNSFEVTFKTKGKKYRYKSVVDCSRKNVYYKGIFEIDGVRKNSSLFRSLIK